MHKQWSSTKSIIVLGSGILAMPLALSRIGILLGIFILLWSGLTSALGLYLQTRCARYLERGSSSFFALSQITYPNAAVIFDSAIAIKCFGVGISYLIIIGDLMPGVVRGFSEDAASVGFLVNRRFWVTGFMSVPRFPCTSFWNRIRGWWYWKSILIKSRLIIMPLSFLRRLDSLKYTSVVALISIGYLVILVVAHFVEGDTKEDRGEIRVIHWESAVATLSSIPVIVFGYTCHQNVNSLVLHRLDPFLLKLIFRCFQSWMRSKIIPSSGQLVSLLPASAPPHSYTF